MSKPACLVDQKQRYHFDISVEGEVCEALYFKHLAKLINESPLAKFKIDLNCRKASPHDFARRNECLYGDKKGKQVIPYMHIQDIEDCQSACQQAKFKALLDEIHNTERKHRITYQLGYSNYTFELWMLLHVADMTHSVLNRYAYLDPINRYFAKAYANLDE